jgi:excisionase family DNA binding protein
METTRTSARRPTEIASDALATPEEIAELLRVPVQLLYRWRYERKGPPSFRIGRYVRYRRSEVERWLDSQAAGDSSIR